MNLIKVYLSIAKLRKGEYNLHYRTCSDWENIIMAKITHEEKMETKKRIDEAARAVFAEKGILKASIREIAKKAGVGASTLYGYYKSKPMLFIETLLPSLESRQLMNDTLDKIDFKTATLDDIVDKIAEAVFFLPISMHNFDRKIVRELHMVIFTEAKDQEEIRDRMISFMENEVTVILDRFFKRMVDENIFKVEINPSEIAELIISIMRLIFLEYVIILAYSKEECYAKLRNSIRLILVGKI